MSSIRQLYFLSFQVFNKGEEWLEAYEKYLTDGKIIPLELEQMKLTEEEKIKKQTVVRGDPNEIMLPELFRLLAISNHRIPFFGCGIS